MKTRDLEHGGASAGRTHSDNEPASPDALEKAASAPVARGRSRRRPNKATPARRARDISRKRKLAYLLSLEVRRIVEDVEFRQPLLVEVWGKMRARQPLLNLIRCRYEELKPDDLLTLPVECIEHLDRFYRTLDELRLYFQTTEDMPTALDITYQRYRLALSQISRALLEHLDAAHNYVSAGSAEPDDGPPARLTRGEHGRADTSGQDGA